MPKNTLTAEEQVTYINKVIEAQARKRAKQQIYAWKPISYDEFKSLQYLLGRSAAEYATLVRVFDEIKRRDEQFKPRSFIDFGSGVGTGTWAVSTLWKEHIFEYVSIDASADMNDLAELILRGGEINKAMSLKNVFYRQFLPASHNKYDIVLSAFSLFELPSKKNRLDVLENLWNKCDGYLVLVEQGSFAGFSLIEEAREFMLKKFETSEVEYHIFSPVSMRLDRRYHSRVLQINSFFSVSPSPAVSSYAVGRRHSVQFRSDLQFAAAGENQRGVQVPVFLCGVQKRPSERPEPLSPLDKANARPFEAFDLPDVHRRRPTAGNHFHRFETWQVSNIETH